MTELVSDGVGILTKKCGSNFWLLTALITNTTVQIVKASKIYRREREASLKQNCSEQDFNREESK